MTHCVNAQIDPLKPARPDQMLDRLPPKSQSQQLPMGDDAVLANREFDDPPITWAV